MSEANPTATTDTAPGQPPHADAALIALCDEHIGLELGVLSMFHGPNPIADGEEQDRLDKASGRVMATETITTPGDAGAGSASRSDSPQLISRPSARFSATSSAAFRPDVLPAVKPTSGVRKRLQLHRRLELLVCAIRHLQSFRSRCLDPSRPPSATTLTGGFPQP